jgi:hypothetical protein
LHDFGDSTEIGEPLENFIVSGGTAAMFAVSLFLRVAQQHIFYKM